MIEDILKIKNAFVAGTLFSGDLQSRLFVLAEAELNGGAGFNTLAGHINTIQAELPERMAVMREVSKTNPNLLPNELMVGPFVGSVTGAGTELVTNAEAVLDDPLALADFDNQAAQMVVNENQAFDTGIKEIEAFNFALEIYGLIDDGVGEIVAAEIGGPVLTEILDSRWEAFSKKWGLDNDGEDDGSVIGDDPDDCPCC